MQKLPAPSRPQYMVSSVDKALRLVHMLRDHGEVRLRTAAEELGVAESTVHRLMAMLVFHGFARQSDSRSYVPGFTIGAAPVRASWTKELRDVAIPHVKALSEETGETANVLVRVGTKIRFLWSQEGDKFLRIVPRIGGIIPAVNAAGGRILLANLGEETLRRLYQGPLAEAQGEALSDRQFELFARELRLCRQNGYAMSNQDTEVGVAAAAVPIHNEEGAVIAAVSIAAPSVRYSELTGKPTMRALLRARDGIEKDLHSSRLEAEESPARR